MTKSKGTSSLISTMSEAGAKRPALGGEFGTGLDFEKSPTEKISGHNVYQQTTGRTVTGKKTLVTPMKPPVNVKVDE